MSIAASYLLQLQWPWWNIFKTELICILFNASNVTAQTVKSNYERLHNVEHTYMR